MAKSYLDLNGLQYLWEKIKTLANGKVDKETGKGLSSNDYTAAEKTKLAGIAQGAQVNVLEGIQVNGATVTPTNKIANIPAMTGASASAAGANGVVPKPAAGDQAKYLRGDGTWQTPTDTKYTPASATRIMDGSGAVGTSAKYAREDHVHPSDTSRVPTTRKINGRALSADVTLYGSDIPYDSAKTVSERIDDFAGISIDGVAFGTGDSVMHYAVCETAANEADKVVHIDNFIPPRDESGNFVIETGSRVLIKFANSNTVTSNLTLNVSGTGAKPIKYKGNNLTSENNFSTNEICEFVYDGTNWEIVGDLTPSSVVKTSAHYEGVQLLSEAHHYATCTTAAATAAKVATIANRSAGSSGFNLAVGARVFVKFTYAIGVANATLNVNGTGARPIYYNGAALAKNLTDANGTYEFVYNGTQWELVGDLDSNTTYSTLTQALVDTGTETTGKLVTAKIIRDSIDNAIEAAQVGAAMFQGTINANSTLTDLTDYKKGWYWVVATAGTYAGQVCEVGDMIFCVSDRGSAFANADFSVVQNNLDMAAITNAEIDSHCV